jgi:hypothetical protein
LENKEFMIDILSTKSSTSSVGLVSKRFISAAALNTQKYTVTYAAK